MRHRQISNAEILLTVPRPQELPEGNTNMERKSQWLGPPQKHAVKETIGLGKETASTEQNVMQRGHHNDRIKLI